MRNNLRHITRQLSPIPLILKLSLRNHSVLKDRNSNLLSSKGTQNFLHIFWILSQSFNFIRMKLFLISFLIAGKLESFQWKPFR